MTDLLWRLFYRAAFLAQLAVHFVLRPQVVGAHVVVRVGEKVLVVRNSYRKELGFPAGRVGRGEDVGEAARRELFEEVGITAPPEGLRPLGVVVKRHEFKTDHAHFFELALDAEPEVAIDRREVVWAGFLDRDSLADARVQATARAWLDGEIPA